MAMEMEMEEKKSAKDNHQHRRHSNTSTFCENSLVVTQHIEVVMPVHVILFRTCIYILIKIY